MFGDNLSLISDTTIAAVLSQAANFKAKFRLNLKVAVLAAILTLVFLVTLQEQSTIVTTPPYDLILVTPYFFLLILACCGVNVFTTLFLAIGMAALVGFWRQGYTFLQLSHDLTHGFASMHDIMLLSLLIGGLSGLIGNNIHVLGEKIAQILGKHGNAKIAQLVIAKIVSLFDICFANNTIAIIFSGEIAQKIAKDCKIPPHYSATWLDIFSCVFQGLLPYGAQILLASSLAGLSPLSVTPHVYYCYILGLVSVGFILMQRTEQSGLELKKIREQT